MSKPISGENRESMLYDLQQNMDKIKELLRESVLLVEELAGDDTTEHRKTYEIAGAGWFGKMLSYIDDNHSQRYCQQHTMHYTYRELESMEVEDE